MTNTCGIRVLIAAAVVCAAVLLAPAPGRSQRGDRPRPISAARAQNIARRIELNATTLTIFDRQGKTVATIGPRALYSEMALSPDGKRLAAVKPDLENGTRDIWVLDVATGAGTRLTLSQRRESAAEPVWSADGAHVAFVGLRSGNFGIYRKASSGQGAEELLYESPGAPRLADWSMDGRFLSLFSSTPDGGVLSVLPLDGAERKPVEVYRTASGKQLSGGWFSPDSRFLTYVSDESGRNELYVRPRDRAAGAGPWRVSTQGVAGGSLWRGDGKELYYTAPDQGVMAVQVNISPAVSFGKPRLLFRPLPGKFQGFSISRDGARILMAGTPPSRMRQIKIFDRQGRVVKTVGEPGFYQNLSISPDGTRVAVSRTDLKTGNFDVWTFDLTTSKSYAVTSDAWEDFDPVWSPDGKQLAYVSSREQYDGIYRKTWDATSTEELLFRSSMPGGGIELTDWSPDGKLLTLDTGAISVVPLHAGEKALDRKPLDWLREEYDAHGGWFSPDMRYLAYLSNETSVDINELYIRPFDVSKPETSGPVRAVKLSDKGVLGGVSWRKDAQEITWVNRDMEVVAADVTTTPTLRVGPPKMLFKLPGLLAAGASRDGQRFVFLVPVMP